MRKETKKRRTYLSKAAEFVEKNNNGLEKWLPLTRNYGNNSIEQKVFGSKTNGKTGRKIKSLVHPLRQYFLWSKGQKLITRLAPTKKREIGYIKIMRGGDETSALKYDQRKIDMARSYTLAAHRDIDKSIELYPNNPEFRILTTEMPFLPQIRYDKRPLITDGK